MTVALFRRSRLRARARARALSESAPHDVNGKDAALVPGEQIIDEIADDRVRFVAQLGHDPADEGAAATVPLEIDRAVHVARAVDLGPTMWTARLLRPRLDESKFLLQLRIARDLAA